MATARNSTRKYGPLPTTFDALVREMPPRAIGDESHHGNTVEMIDRLMALDRPTKGQAEYLETLVQLVEAYEREHHAIEGLEGLSLLQHLVQESRMNVGGLAALLGVHASTGSKILSGARSLTVEHSKLLASRFGVKFHAFLA